MLFSPMFFSLHGGLADHSSVQSGTGSGAFVGALLPRRVTRKMIGARRKTNEQRSQSEKDSLDDVTVSSFFVNENSERFW